jgi:hypothetical protein
LGDRRIYIEADSTGTHVPELDNFVFGTSVIATAVDSNWYAERKSPCTPFFFLGLSHASSKVANEVAFGRIEACAVGGIGVNTTVG